MKRNRFFDAVLKLMLLSAIIHMVILAIYILMTGDTSKLSFFKIVAIDLFYPSLGNTSIGHFLSFLAVVVLYILVYIFFTNKDKILK